MVFCSAPTPVTSTPTRPTDSPNSPEGAPPAWGHGPPGAPAAGRRSGSAACAVRFSLPVQGAAAVVRNAARLRPEQRRTLAKDARGARLTDGADRCGVRRDREDGGVLPGSGCRGVTEGTARCAGQLGLDLDPLRVPYLLRQAGRFREDQHPQPELVDQQLDLGRLQHIVLLGGQRGHVHVFRCGA